MPKIHHPRSHLARAVLLASLALPLTPQITLADNITTTWDGSAGDWFDPTK